MLLWPLTTPHRVNQGTWKGAGKTALSLAESYIFASGVWASQVGEANGQTQRMPLVELLCAWEREKNNIQEKSVRETMGMVRWSKA